VVPGNHDILIDDQQVTRDYENEQPFRDFIQLVYGREVSLERVQWIQDALGVNYFFCALNSARPRQVKTMDYGYVGIDRSRPVLERAAALRRALPAGNRSWTSMVLHHHVQPAQMLEQPEDGRPVSLTLDAGELVSLCHEYEVDAILHGHQHLPFFGSATRYAECGPSPRTRRRRYTRPVLVLGAGSAGVKGDRIPDEIRMNCMSTYRLEQAGLRIQVSDFSPRKQPEVFWHFFAHDDGTVEDMLAERTDVDLRTGVQASFRRADPSTAG
jgi:hypothetical protein